MGYSKDVTARHLAAQMALAGMKKPEDLSVASGVSADAIGKYLRGDSAPLLSTAFALAEALGCSINDICGWNDPDTRTPVKAGE